MPLVESRLRRGTPALTAMILSLLGVLVFSPRAFAVGYPAGTLVVFNPDFGVRWILRDGTFVVGGFRNAFGSFPTAGLAATSDGKVLEAFSGFDAVPEGEVPVSGIDVLSPEGKPESRLLFANHHFDGIAISDRDDIWVSDDFTRTLLKIDLANGSILDELSLQGAELLQDIDANGFFYLAASTLGGAGVRIRDPDGAHVRDIALEGTILPPVRIDRDGRLLVIVRGVLYALLPDGQVVDTVGVGAVSYGFTLTPERTGWFGISASEEQAGVVEIAANGTSLRTVALPDVGLGYTGSADFLAFVPRAPRGSLCNQQSCPGITPTPTKTLTVEATSTPAEPTATPTDVGPPSPSSGCQAAVGDQGPWSLLILLAAFVRRRRRIASLSYVAMTLLLVHSPSAVVAAEWYVDCSNGSDSNSGASPSAAWKKVQRAANVVAGGDIVHVFSGPCVEQNITFDRAALSGPGDCTVGRRSEGPKRGQAAFSTSDPRDIECLDGEK